MTFEKDEYKAMLRDGTTRRFKDLTDDELLDTINYYESKDIKNCEIRLIEPYTYGWLLKYAEYRNLIMIIDESELTNE